MARHSNKNKQKEVPKQFQTIRELFFHTPIFYKDLSNSKELNKHLLKHIKKWKQDDEKGIVRSNSLGWHSAVDMHHKKEYYPLTKELFKMQQEIYEAEGYHPNTEPICDNMWANVNYKYSHNKNLQSPIAIILHPDPSRGGTMNTKIVFKLYKIFENNGFSTIRFNFRGVGKSEGNFDDGEGELEGRG